jgi:thioredoxin reductase
VSGVFAAGDCATILKTVTQAIAMGTAAAGGIASQVQADMEHEA